MSAFFQSDYQSPLVEKQATSNKGREKEVMWEERKHSSIPSQTGHTGFLGLWAGAVVTLSRLPRCPQEWSATLAAWCHRALMAPRLLGLSACTSLPAPDAQGGPAVLDHPGSAVPLEREACFHQFHTLCPVGYPVPPPHTWNIQKMGGGFNELHNSPSGLQALEISMKSHLRAAGPGERSSERL